jgi:hypothetical protein
MANTKQSTNAKQTDAKHNKQATDNQRKLTPEDVRLIRALDREREYHRMMADRLTRLEIADKFDVSYTTIVSVCTYKSYVDVQDV